MSDSLKNLHKPGLNYSYEWDESKLPLLFLVPLVQTAWAHGAIARSEKNLIFEAAREDEVDARSPLNDQLDYWLVYQPSRKFFVDCLDKIMAVLQSMTVREREALKTKIINRCRRIAGSAGGNSSMDISSFISPEEEETLAEIAETLDIRLRDGRPGLRLETQHGFR